MTGFPPLRINQSSADQLPRCSSAPAPGARLPGWLSPAWDSSLEMGWTEDINWEYKWDILGAKIGIVSGIYWDIGIDMQKMIR